MSGKVFPRTPGPGGIGFASPVLDGIAARRACFLREAQVHASPRVRLVWDRAVSAFTASADIVSASFAYEEAQESTGLTGLLDLDTCKSTCYLLDVKSWSSREVLKILANDGWTVKRQVGSHVQLVHPSKPGKVTVPHPKKDLAPATVRSIARQAKLDLEG